MIYRRIDHEKLDRLHDFIFMLNKESENGSVIVVEGKRDVRALTKAGFNGNLSVFHHFRGVSDFVDNHSLYNKKIILLFDMDRTGKHLTRKILSQLQCRGGNVSLLYKKKLAGIDNGKIRHVEDLSSYAPYLSGITGSRLDLYFYT
ncbi:MAG TPA: toprim domain-containing protein [Nitrososphaeraceae archaeon]|jgi:5S rRNA maturation endonuclease (ribonuclease M5)